MAEFSLNKFKRSTLKKQAHLQQQTSDDDAAAAFIFTRSQQKCNNISIQLPFEIRTNDMDSLDSTASLANNNLFLQTPVLKLKIDKSLQEISPMEINRLAAKNEPISIFSRCDLATPNRNINNNVHLDHSYDRIVDVETTTTAIATTPNIDFNKKYKAPTTPHRILCQFRSTDAAAPEELATKIAENNNENDMDSKLKVCLFFSFFSILLKYCYFKNFLVNISYLTSPIYTFYSVLFHCKLVNYVFDIKFSI